MRSRSTDENSYLARADDVQRRRERRASAQARDERRGDAHDERDEFGEDWKRTTASDECGHANGARVSVDGRRWTRAAGRRMKGDEARRATFKGHSRRR